VLTMGLAGSLLFSAAALPSPQSSQTAAPVRVDTIVRIAGAPAHPGVATLLEEVSIGAAVGADHYMLGSVGDLAVSPNGSMYVYDPSVPSIRMYDSTGRYVRSVGRGGAGPGEYRANSGLEVLKDGRVLLWDTGKWRINIYSPSGEFLSQIPTPSGSAGSSLASATHRLLVESDGRVSFPVTAGRAATFRPIWVRMKLDGTAVDTLYPPEIASTPTPLRAVASDGLSRRGAAVPFSPAAYVTRSPLGYFVTGLSSRYAFELHPPTSSVLSIRRDVRGEPVSRAERDTARARVVEMMRTIDPSWQWSGPEIPAFKASYSRLTAASDGRIWVYPGATMPPTPSMSSQMSGGAGAAERRAGGAARLGGCPMNDAAVADVFEPTGVYVGRVQLPKGLQIIVQKGYFVWGAACGDGDIPMVKRYRIDWK
jgi:hypothetical protein